MRLLTTADFAGLEGSGFRVESPGGPVALVLERVDPLPGAARDGGAFRLTFRGPAASLHAQGTYAFARDGEDAQEIFIVPVSRDERGIEYEAIFA